MATEAPVAADQTSPSGDYKPLVLQDIEAGYYEHDLILSEVNMIARPNQVTVVLGPNGSGKSTSLRVAAGILTPRKGRVLLGDEDITLGAAHQRIEHGIALLPQGRSVFPELTVEENLEIGAWMYRSKRSRLREAIDQMYERYPLLKQHQHRMAGSLSGGQQRIVELARMMVSDPQVLLIDEPSVGLAPKLVKDVYEEISKFKDEQRTILLVDQNIEAAVELADFVYTLKYGRNHLEGNHRQFEGQLSDLVKDWLQF